MGSDSNIVEGDFPTTVAEPALAQFEHPPWHLMSDRGLIATLDGEREELFIMKQTLERSIGANIAPLVAAVGSVVLLVVTIGIAVAPMFVTTVTNAMSAVSAFGVVVFAYFSYSSVRVYRVWRTAHRSRELACEQARDVLALVTAFLDSVSPLKDEAVSLAPAAVPVQLIAAQWAAIPEPPDPAGPAPGSEPVRSTPAGRQTGEPTVSHEGSLKTEG